MSGESTSGGIQIIMTIKDLGRWESLEMVQRYTRSVTFEDSLKFYKAPLGYVGNGYPWQ